LSFWAQALECIFWGGEKTQSFEGHLNNKKGEMFYSKYLKFNTMKSHFCHQSTKTPNFTQFTVLIMRFGVPNFWDW